ncbi:flavin reductase family protein [Micromonospora vinacea]|uniref:flavin reductase family protein n=1 Tax=Micromonospora vinacea TaxID=709878 RepID=UPI003F570E25
MTAHPQPTGLVTDSKTLRWALAAFATGVTVVTVGGPTPHGMTANSFTAVSLDPPLALVCVGRDAMMHGALTEAGQFGVSVLAAGQEPVARYFADRRRPLGREQFEFAEWQAGSRTGSPLLVGAIAHFECELWQAYDGGDHSIFIGRLVALDRNADDALVFVDGQFRQLERERSGATT